MQSNSDRKKRNPFVKIVSVIISIFIIIPLLLTPSKDGYYKYDNRYYYYQSSTWYIYSGYGVWEESYAPKELKNNYKEYFLGEDYSIFYGITDFKYSEFYRGTYVEPEYNSSTDSWNSNSIDWDNDW